MARESTVRWRYARRFVPLPFSPQPSVSQAAARSSDRDGSTPVVQRCLGQPALGTEQPAADVLGCRWRWDRASGEAEFGRCGTATRDPCGCGDVHTGRARRAVRAGGARETGETLGGDVDADHIAFGAAATGAGPSAERDAGCAETDLGRWTGGLGEAAARLADLIEPAGRAAGAAVGLVGLQGCTDPATVRRAAGTAACSLLTAPPSGHRARRPCWLRLALAVLALLTGATPLLLFGGSRAKRERAKHPGDGGTKSTTAGTSSG